MSYGITVTGEDGVDSSMGIDNYILIQHSKTRMHATNWSAARGQAARLENFTPDVGGYIEIRINNENSAAVIRTRGQGWIEKYNLVNTATTNPPSDNYGMNVYNNKGIIFSSAIKPMLIIDAIFVLNSQQKAEGSGWILHDKTYTGETKLGVSLEYTGIGIYPNESITMKIHHVSPGRLKITYTRTGAPVLYESQFKIIRAY